MNEKIKVRRTFISVVLIILLFLGAVVTAVLLTVSKPQNIEVRMLIGGDQITKEIKQGDYIDRPDSESIQVPQGFSFDNWYADEAYTVLYDFSNPINKNTNVYGRLIPNKYSVNFFYNYAEGAILEGDIFRTVTGDYGSNFQIPGEAPLRTNYNFIGYTRSAVPEQGSYLYSLGEWFSMPFEGANFYAQYKGEEKQVIINYQDARKNGQEIAETEMKAYFGEDFILPSSVGIHHKDYTKVFLGYTIEGGDGTIYAGSSVVLKDIINELPMIITLNEAWGDPSGEVVLNWNLQGESPEGLITSLKFVEGHVFTLPTGVEVEYAHHDFAGWILGDNFDIVYSTYTMPSNTVQLNAVWDRKQYTVTYEGNGSTSGITQTETRAYNTSVTVKAAIFSKTNYSFVDWNTKPDGSGDSFAPNSSFNISSDFTLYAQWEGNLQTIRFKDVYLLESGYHADIRFETEQVNYGESFSLPENFNLSNDLLRTLSNGDYNKWLDGVYIEGSPNVIYGASRQHDEVGKTYSNITQFEITGNLSLYLNFAVSGNRLRFVANADDSTWTPQDYTYVTGHLTYIPISIPYRNGYSFVGWTDTQAEYTYVPGEPFEMPGGVNTFYAKWQGQERSLTYNGGVGGALVGEGVNAITHYTLTNERVYEGDTITLADILFEKDGWYQVGWNTKADGTGKNYALFDDENPSNPDSKIDINEFGDIVLWAVYQENALTFSFAGGLGNVTGSVSDVSAIYQQFAFLPNNGFERENYVFAGWSRNINATVGSGEVFAEGFGYLAVSNTTFYAIWTGASISVYYNANKENTTGTVDPSTGQHGGSLLIKDGSGLSNPNFEFSSWNTKSDGLGEVYAPGILSDVRFVSDITLYAVWTPKAKTVTYVASDGTSTETVVSTHIGGATIRYGDNYEVQSMGFVYLGYDFVGWNDRSTGLGNNFAVGSTLNISGNMTLFAVWKPTLRTITIDLSDIEDLSDLIINGVAITENPEFLSNKQFVEYVENNGSVVLPNLTHLSGQIINSSTFQMYAGFEILIGGVVGTTYVDGGTMAGVAGDITLGISWTSAGATRVDFDSSGGTPGYSSILPVANSVDMPLIAPTREGFSFLGWSDDNGVTLHQAGDLGVVVSSNTITTFVAQWQAEVRNVIFNIGDGTTGSVSSILNAHYGDVVTLPSGAGLARTGYTFVGWGFIDFVSGGVVNITAAEVQNAKVYGVVLQSLLNLGLQNHAIDIWSNGSASTINSIFDINSDFMVLNNGLSGFDTVVYAVWLPDTITIRIEGNGGLNSDGAGYVEYETAYDQELLIANVFNVPSVYYTFDGIGDVRSGAYTDLNGSSVTPKTTSLAIVSNTITLFARWTPKMLTVHYSDILDTTVDLETTALYNSDYTLLNLAGVEALKPAYDGAYDSRLTLYDFVGWKIGVQPFAVLGAGQTINGIQADSSGGFDVWLYATWTGKTISITYNDNAASAATRTTSWNYGENYTFEGKGLFNIPSEFGNGTFAGWSLVSNYQNGIDFLFVAGSSVVLNSTLSSSIESGITFYAVWVAEQIKVTYNMNGSSSPNIETAVNYGGSHSIVAFTPTRTGYTFRGWTTETYKDTKWSNIPSQYQFVNDGNPATYELVGLTQNVVLYAVWDAVSLLISVYKNGGTFKDYAGDPYPFAISYGLNLKMADYFGTSASHNASLSRTNYTLVGFIDSNGTLYNLDTIYNITSSFSITAVWSPNNISITYHGAGGRTGEPLGETVVGSLLAGQTVTLFDLGFVREGFELIGWSLTLGGPVDYALGSTFIPAGSMDLYAVWEGEEVIITYYSNNGSGQVYENTGTIGEDYTIKDIDDQHLEWVKAGHNFVGWVSAQYANAASWGDIPETDKFEANDTFSVAAGTLLYAYWSPNLYEITFVKGEYDAAGHEILGPISGSMSGYSQYFGRGFMLPNNGFNGSAVEFDYYSLNSDGSGTKYYPGDVINISGNMNVYTIFKYRKITITFVGNGADGGVAPDSVQVALWDDIGYVLPQNTFTRTDYTFVGWKVSFSKDPVSTGVVTHHFSRTSENLWGLRRYVDGVFFVRSNSSIAGLLNGYSVSAVWERNTTTITLNANNSTSEPAAVLTANQNENYTLPDNGDLLTPFTPSQEYFRLAFWSTSATDDPTAVAGEGVSRYFAGDPISVGTTPIVLFAIWEQDTFTLTFKSNGGGVNDIVWTFNKRAAPYKLDSPEVLLITGLSGYPSASLAGTISGYNFYGWHTNQDWNTTNDFDGTLNSLSGFVGNDISRYLRWLRLAAEGPYDYEFGGSIYSEYISGESSNVTYYATWIQSFRTAKIELSYRRGNSPSNVSTRIEVPVGLTEFTFMDAVILETMGYVLNRSVGVETYDDVLTAHYNEFMKPIMNAAQLTGTDLSNLVADVSTEQTSKNKLMVYNSYLNLELLSADTPKEMLAKIIVKAKKIDYNEGYAHLGGWTNGHVSAWVEGETVDYSFGETYNTTTMPQFNPISTSADRKYHSARRSIEYSIVYNSNKPAAAVGTIGGTMSDTNHSYEFIDTDTILANQYSLTGYEFKGWTSVQYKNTAWNSISSINKLVDEDLVRDVKYYGPLYVSGDGYYVGKWVDGAVFTLYAVWEVGTYSVELDPNGGAVGEYSDWVEGNDVLTKGFVYYNKYTGVVAPYENNGVTQVGNNFLGWWTQKSGGVQVFDVNGQLNPSIAGFSDAECRWLKTEPVTLYAQWAAMLGLVKFASQPWQPATQLPNNLSFSYNPSGNNVIIPNNVQSGSGYRRVQSQSILMDAAGNNGGSGTNRSVTAYSDVMYYSLTPYDSYEDAMADKVNWISKESLSVGSSKSILSLFPDFWTTKGGLVTLYPIWRDYLQPIATTSDFNLYLFQHLDNLGDEYSASSAEGGKFVYYQTGNITLGDLEYVTEDFYGKYYGQGLSMDAQYAFSSVRSGAIVNGCVFVGTRMGTGLINSADGGTINFNTYSVVNSGHGSLDGGFFVRVFNFAGPSVISYNVFDGSITRINSVSLTGRSYAMIGTITKSGVSVVGNVFSGSVTVTNDSSTTIMYMGGVIGATTVAVNIKDNIFSGTISLQGAANAQYIGGIAGCVEGIGAVEHTGNISTGSILLGTESVKSSAVFVDSTYIGGVFGLEGTTPTSQTVFSNDFSGRIEIYNSSTDFANIFIGGVIGSVPTTLNRVTIKGNVTPNIVVDVENDGSLQVGGVMGSFYLSSAVYTSNIATGTLGGSIYVKHPSYMLYVGGVIGQTHNLKQGIDEIVNNTSVTVEMVTGGSGQYQNVGGVVGNGNSSNDVFKGKNTADILMRGIYTHTSSHSSGVGGVFGRKYGGTVEGANSGNITVEDNIQIVAAGIVASGYSGSDLIIKNSYNTGNITGYNCAGILGSHGGLSDLTLSRVENRGNITGKHNIAGILGFPSGGNRIMNVTIEYAQNSGKIYVSGSNVGGIMSGGTSGGATNAVNVTMTDVVNLGEVSNGDAGRRSVTGGILSSVHWGTTKLVNVINAYPMEVGSGGAIIGDSRSGTSQGTIITENVYHVIGASSIHSGSLAGNIAGAAISIAEMQIERSAGSIYQYFGKSSGEDGIFGTADDVVTEDFGEDGIYGTADDVCVWDFATGQNPRLWFGWNRDYNIEYNNEKGYHTLEFGEYPQTFVGAAFNTELESYITDNNINAAGVLAGLQATGKSWSSNGASGSSGGYTSKLNVEYLYQGQKYVRASNNSAYTGPTYVFSDSTLISYRGVFYWFKVEPIKWIIMNWDKLPVYINPEGSGTAIKTELYAENMLIGGISSYPNQTDENCSMWQNSTPRGWLNGINVNNLPTNGAPSGGDFSGVGFYYEAFNENEQGKIATTTVYNTDNLGTGKNNAEGDGPEYNTYDKVYLPSRYDLLNASSSWNWLFNSNASRCNAPNDYTKAHGVFLSPSFNGNTYYWQRTTDSNDNTYLVMPDGTLNMAGSGTLSYRHAGIRPAINIEMILPNRVVGGTGIAATPEGIHTVSVGGYPKTFVGVTLNNTLESYITSGVVNAAGIAAGLGETGKTYVGNSRAWNDPNPAPYYSEKFNKEYYFGGDKYVRMSSLRYAADPQYTFDDGTAFDSGVYYWFKVEPIKWIVLNWDNLPTDINPDGDGTALTMVLFAETAVTAGIPFYPNNTDSNITMWQNSTVRAYLNGINVNNLPTDGAPAGGDFSGKGLYNEAFTASEQAMIALTTGLVNNDYDAAGGANTDDYIYLPSHYEMTNALSLYYWLFNSDASRVDSPTDYVKACGIWISPEGNCEYNLRSAYSISQFISIDAYGASLHLEFAGVVDHAIRPMMQISLA